MADFDESSESRKRKAPSPANSIKSTASKRSKPNKASPSSTTEKSNRGLRHFSMMVCQKVEEKGTTTYNEVADELVKKVIAERESEGKFDEKNIRRRVYDALNVLMAMDIISKEKKEITWRGLPSVGNRKVTDIRDEIEMREMQIARKQEAVRELLVQQVCFRNLVWHNHHRHSEEKIPLPFIIVNTHASAVIQCDMSRDRTDVMFEFSMPFEINDDNTILKKMGLDKTTMSDLRSMLPADLMQYCQDHRLLDGVLGHERHHPSMLPPSRHHYRSMEPLPHPSEMHHPHQQHHPRGVVYPPQHYSGYDPMMSV